MQDPIWNKHLERFGSEVRASTGNAGDLGSIPGLGRSPEEGNGNPSSILAWRISWREEPGGLQATGSQKSDTIERLHFHFHSISGFSKENNGIISKHEGS